MSAFRALEPFTMLSPVPAVMVSCCAPQEDAKPNIITIAWVGTVNSDPPMVSISVQKKRYSYDMIVHSGEFVVNLVGKQQCRSMDYCGVRSGRDCDKWADCRLTPVPAQGMDHAPAIAQCPGYLSCKVRQMIELGSHVMFIGEVVGVGVQEELFDADGSMHLERAELVTKAHGLYQKATDVLGFFGYSVARPEVLKRRMSTFKTKKGSAK
ncbi:MAG: flavin reductase family protein [Clostridiales bacterium]|nr:flavin reductase family protein [Clostridiales bacterium]